MEQLWVWYRNIHINQLFSNCKLLELPDREKWAEEIVGTDLESLCQPMHITDADRLLNDSQQVYFVNQFASKIIPNVDGDNVVDHAYYKSTMETNPNEAERTRIFNLFYSTGIPGNRDTLLELIRLKGPSNHMGNDLAWLTGPDEWIKVKFKEYAEKFSYHNLNATDWIYLKKHTQFSEISDDEIGCDSHTWVRRFLSTFGCDLREVDRMDPGVQSYWGIHEDIWEKQLGIGQMTEVRVGNVVCGYFYWIMNKMRIEFQPIAFHTAHHPSLGILFMPNSNEITIPIWFKIAGEIGTLLAHFMSRKGGCQISRILECLGKEIGEQWYYRNGSKYVKLWYEQNKVTTVIQNVAFTRAVDQIYRSPECLEGCFSKWMNHEMGPYIVWPDTYHLEGQFTPMVMPGGNQFYIELLGKSWACFYLDNMNEIMISVQLSQWNTKIEIPKLERFW